MSPRNRNSSPLTRLVAKAHLNTITTYSDNSFVLFVVIPSPIVSIEEKDVTNRPIPNPTKKPILK